MMDVISHIGLGSLLIKLGKDQNQEEGDPDLTYKYDRRKEKKSK